jgi:hypothetical protein
VAATLNYAKPTVEVNPRSCELHLAASSQSSATSKHAPISRLGHSAEQIGGSTEGQTGFDRVTIATNAAAQDVADPAEELRARCRAYCRFALEHPRLCELLFQADLRHSSVYLSWAPPMTTRTSRYSGERSYGSMRAHPSYWTTPLRWACSLGV